MSCPDHGRLQVQVLVVCRANICRSPLGAEVIRRHLEKLSVGDVIVRSAGSDAAHGSRICAVAVSMLESRGELPAELLGREPVDLDEALIRSSDLILTMGLSHRSAVIAKVPSARDRTFTIVEARKFAQAAARGPGGCGGPDSWAESLNGMRGMVVLDERAPLFGRSQGISIDDGHTKSPRAHRKTLARVEQECRDLVEALAGLSPLSGTPLQTPAGAP